MGMETGYWLAASGGLLGSFGHCIGMCGPIAAGFSLSQSGASARKVMVPQVLYNAGRVTTYTAAGGVMGAAGSFADIAARAVGFQGAVLLIAGVLMVVMGLYIVVSRSARFLEKHNMVLLRAAARLAGGHSVLRFYPLGLVLGLLPCGLSYTYFIGAAGTGNAVHGALTMLAFGVGTLPAMLILGAVVTAIGSRARSIIYRLGGVAVAAMGGYFLIMGLEFYANL
jgi:sulfite exporter TauE/SafE